MISPGRYSVRSAGSVGAYSGRSCATLARSTEADRVHPIRLPITVAGIVGVAASNARICGSYASTAETSRLTPIHRRLISGQRRPHRVPGDSEMSRDGLDRHPLRLMQAPNLGPVLHADHSL